MNKNSIIKDKSEEFALDIIQLYRKLINKKEFILSKQILKSGTSIGANLEEAYGAQSRKDFTSKIFIAYKEARETRYWLRLLDKSNLIDTKKSLIYREKIDQICKILGKMLKTLRS